ncbi:MAG: hypothetical protein ABWY05_14730 [Noviherbaspirillum sp.]
MRDEYAAMLGRLCRLTGVPPAEQPQVVAQQAMMMDGLPTRFRLEDWSGFVKIYIEIGLPAPARLPSLCQAILEQQLTLPAPFAMLAALDAASGSLILYGCAPLAASSEEDDAFLAFLQGCADAALLLRGALDEDDGRAAAFTS